MEVTDEKSLQPFKQLMDEYDQSFYNRNIDKFRSLHVSDNGVVFFDNHANCDSSNYKAHEDKVANFFQHGDIGSLIRENVRVFITSDMACITAMLRYSSKPYPGVRTTYVLERDSGAWKIRHMHHSFDPNELSDS
ncbi:nuclear transport factor 2 family protein [Zooshikella sp. RANM57]|uniref:nuclear transport factor 2 family protein n=1 Tax=Zooshikella sp. RANM57 TaxID=3425863 RepID=UPI003D6DEB0A